MNILKISISKNSELPDIYRLIIPLHAVILLFSALGGCVPAEHSAATRNLKKNSQTINESMMACSNLESEKKYLDALACYTAVLEDNPGNATAESQKHAIESMLKAESGKYLQTGLVYDSRGRCDLGRKEYMKALEAWPDNQQARELINSNKTSYILHVLRENESISGLSMLYYNDYYNYDLIAQFNCIEDAARVDVGQGIKIPTIPGISIEQLEQRNKRYRESGFQIPDRASPTPKQTMASPEPPQTADDAKAGPIPETHRKDKPYVIYTMQPGDTISEISSRCYGTSKVYPFIIAFNKISDVKLLDPGDQIKLPEIDGIASIETLSKAIPPPVSLEQVQASSPSDAGVSALPPKENIESCETELHPPQPDTSDKTENDDPAPPVPDTSHKPDTGPKPATNLELGIQLFEDGDYDSAIKELSIAVHSDQDKTTANDFLYRSFFEKAMLLYTQEDFLNAGTLFESARSIRSSCINCLEYSKKCLAAYKEKHYALGASEFSNENLTNAISHWKLVYDADPDYKDVATNLKKAELIAKKLELIKKSETQ